MHDWAGNGYGVVKLPRVGQEVQVSFEEGDPDKPLIRDVCITENKQQRGSPFASNAQRHSHQFNASVVVAPMSYDLKIRKAKSNYVGRRKKIGMPRFYIAVTPR